jgi:hypothetical protein
VGAAIELETVKPVSQSYLTSLWNHEAFQKNRDAGLDSLTNRYSRRFTFLVVAIALGAAIFWALNGQAARGLTAFTSVLIVACPCALALAAPFTLGTAQRLLARLNVFVKNALVLERMAEVRAIVFDKTGTLTASRGTLGLLARASLHSSAFGAHRRVAFRAPLPRTGVVLLGDTRLRHRRTGAGPRSLARLPKMAGIPRRRLQPPR